MVRAGQGAGRPNRLCQRPLWPPLNKRLPLFIITMFDQDDRNLEIKALQDQMMRLLRVNFGSKIVSVKYISIYFGNIFSSDIPGYGYSVENLKYLLGARSLLLRVFFI